MLRSVKALRGRPIAARDGDMGEVVDVYFDDERWELRYLVVDTRHSMPHREVLVPRSCLGAEPVKGALPVELTRVQVEHSPERDLDLPVWRQHELSFARRAMADRHLRSSGVVIGYSVHALDGVLGRVEDLILNDSGWTVSSLLIALNRWFPGRRVLAPPAAVESIDWCDREVHLRLTREALRALPSAN
jgi:sporulation protein YlmC with PRC-barrel domain